MDKKKTMMWCVKNTHNAPILRGKDFAFVELFCAPEGEVRRYFIDGNGVLYMPALDAAQKSKVTPRPFGTLVLVADTEGKPEAAIDRMLIAIGIDDMGKVLLILANHEW